ncbi:hypothetical protein O181_120301 [Austropuccinia psidii MF-1]|uniref:Tet-like 2OG-Fe(II) oxygenase domain-containing protein n=1 Tax=Austropuccinia psidii MF-1 TaxID=1389203 RepID=A0A9Q3KI62_9BASI|nr:hypothetical protein [Austropuccinia psidii MF-1]
MSDIEVNQWDELSQLLFRKKRFTLPIAANGALLEGFMFAIGWRKCSTKNEQFSPYGSDANASHAKPYACAGSDNAKSSLRLCGVPTLHTPILTPVQAPENLHANPDACEGSQKW